MLIITVKELLKCIVILNNWVIYFHIENLTFSKYYTQKKRPLIKSVEEDAVL